MAAREPGFLHGLDALEVGQAAGGLRGVPSFAVQIVELEGRGRELRVKLEGALELRLCFGTAVQLAIERSELIAPDGLIGSPWAIMPSNWEVAWVASPRFL